MKKKIAIAMGGYSSEYEISIKSGNLVYAHLSCEKYSVFRALILKDEWVVLDETDRKFPIDKSDFSIKIGNEKVRFDCVFNTIHGTPGEDGLFQAYLETIGVPQTACDYYQAALTFNKRDCISVLRGFGIPTATNYFLSKGDPIYPDKIIETVGLPCFVKANKAGSSFGVSKV
ncbi:MAG TPA: D-alanine--D-alanine ligase, partial [Flavobacteriaceae bacterium]|nr:D-alanine--D-alanine ligase [Flavobacteriaceae bacterium]